MLACLPILCYNRGMVPNVHFLGLDLYDWAILCGIVAAMILFRALYKRMGLTYPVFVLSLTVSVFAIVGGYCSAALFQSFYVFLESGTFAWGVGTTFYGGLIGASLIFLALYFGAGHFFCKGAHIRQFNRMLALVAPCIALAHAFGRIGCLLGGCCYGAETESFFGTDNGKSGFPCNCLKASSSFCCVAHLYSFSSKGEGLTMRASISLLTACGGLPSSFSVPTTGAPRAFPFSRPPSSRRSCSLRSVSDTFFCTALS